MAKLGVISDTHGEGKRIQMALDVFKEYGVEKIIHCGDLCVASHLDYFRDIPTEFVYGNCDDCVRNMIANKIEEINQDGGKITLHGDFGEIRFGGKNIAFVHDLGRADVNDGIRDTRWDLICHGHTHTFEYRMDNETIILNPGGIKQYGRSAPSFAVVTLPAINVERINL